MTHFVLVNCNLGHEQEVMQRLQELRIESHAVYGAYDIIAVIHSEDVDFLVRQIRLYKHVRSTMTLQKVDHMRRVEAS